MRPLLSAIAFPVVFVGALVSTWAGLATGLDAPAVVFSVSVAAAVCVTVLERALPYEPQWRERHGDLGTDAIYAVSSLFAAPRLFDLLALSAMTSAGAWMTRTLGHDLWPHAAPWGLQVLLAVVVGEFGSYWWHRAMHERSLLFRLHATHHSAPRLYWFNSTRFHPLDNVVMYAFQVFPLILMGIPEAVLVGFTVWSLVHGFFQHANVDVRLGPLNWFFSMAELHRWHHSPSVEEANHNYGSNCCVWDLVFGTYYLPSDRRPPVNVGLDGMPTFPQRIVGQLLSPFVWPTGGVTPVDTPRAPGASTATPVDAPPSP